MVSRSAGIIDLVVTQAVSALSELLVSRLYAGELDPGQDKEHDAADDGHGR